MSRSIALYWWNDSPPSFKDRIRRIAGRQRRQVRNFGDWLAPFLVQSLTGRPVRHSTGKNKLLSIGSILHYPKDGDTVWGSGIPARHHLPKTNALAVRAVRGPITREILQGQGIDCPEVYGDPALLLPLVLPPSLSAPSEIGLVPHYVHLDTFKKTPELARHPIIDVTDKPLSVVSKITRCKFICSTSLPGLVVAEAYGIPAALLRIKPGLSGDLLKFEDYYHGTGRDLRFVDGLSKDCIGKLQTIALDIPKPAVDLAKLIEAFPFSVLPSIMHHGRSAFA